MNKKRPSQPPEKTASERIFGIVASELDFASALLWQCGVYAKSVADGPEPRIMVAPEDLSRAQSILATAGITGKDGKH